MASHLSTEGLGGSMGTLPSGEKESPEQRCGGGCGTWLSKPNRNPGSGKLCFRCQQKAEDEAREREEREFAERRDRMLASMEAKRISSDARKSRPLPPKPQTPDPPSIDIVTISPPTDPVPEPKIPMPHPLPAPPVQPANDDGGSRPRERMIGFLIKVIRGR